MRIALVQQHATRDESEYVARGLVACAPLWRDHILAADLDLAANARSHARQLRVRHRRPELYAEWIVPVAEPHRG
jgi:hypothetical protein